MPITVKTSPKLSNRNTNSLYNKFSRYVAGGVTERTGNFLEWFEPAVFPKDASDQVYAVENIYENRLDLISAIFYNEPRYWWVIAQYNNIIDPFSEVTAGRMLLIPTANRLQGMLLHNRGGIDSTKEAQNLISPIIT